MGVGVGGVGRAQGGRRGGQLHWGGGRGDILTLACLHGVTTGRVRCGPVVLHKRMLICRSGSAAPLPWELGADGVGQAAGWGDGKVALVSCVAASGRLVAGGQGARITSVLRLAIHGALAKLAKTAGDATVWRACLDFDPCHRLIALDCRQGQGGPAGKGEAGKHEGQRPRQQSYLRAGLERMSCFHQRLL